MYKIHASQGQGDTVIAEVNTLEEALQYEKDYKNQMSIGIEYPNGEWHKWENE